ncbi:MAG TPA: glycosyltransferase family 9 protein [Gemmatimonadaceae bacterium]
MTPGAPDRGDPHGSAAPTAGALPAAGRRVCIVMMSAVGDAVHVLPVVNAIKRHDPASHITWVLQPGPATLVRGHPMVDEIVLFDRRRGWRAFLDVRRALAAREFDVTLALQDYFKAGLITSFTRAPVKLGHDRARARDLTWLFTNRHIPPRPPRHIQDEYLEFVEALGIPAEPVTWGLGPWPEERAWQRELVARFDRPIAALVIGSSRPEKDWLPERWAELADHLAADYGLHPVLVGGRSAREVETERVILERTRHRPTSLLNSGLRRLVGILDASALVVSLDTGPLHMAVALDRPVVSLIGFSNPLRTGPYRRFQDLVVDAYGEATRDGTLATDRRPRNTATITVRDVLERVERWRARYAAPHGAR